jgi:hypothetical protein
LRLAEFTSVFKVKRKLGMEIAEVIEVETSMELGIMELWAPRGTVPPPSKEPKTI